MVVGKSRRACKFGNLNDGSTVAKTMILPLLVGFNLYNLLVIFVEDTTASVQCVFQKVVKIGLNWGKKHGPGSFGKDLSESALTLEVILWTGKQNHTVTQTGTSAPNRGPCLDCGSLSSIVGRVEISRSQ